MNYDYKTILSVAILIVVIGVFGVLWQKPWQTFGSVPAGGNAYQSTTTPEAKDGLLLCTGSSILGSVVMTGPRVGGNMLILDATTTDVVNGNDVRSATTTLILASFAATVSGNASSTGTYTFDSMAKNGLIIASAGNILSTSTITYRCNQ